MLKITVSRPNVRPISHYGRTRWPNISPAHHALSFSRCCQSINYVRSNLTNVRPKGGFERTDVPRIMKNYFQHCMYRSIPIIYGRMMDLNNYQLPAGLQSFFFIRTFFYKNVEAEIDPNFKNVLRTFLRLREVVKSSKFMSCCKPLWSILFLKPNFASVGWRDISHVASEQVKPVCASNLIPYLSKKCSLIVCLVTSALIGWNTIPGKFKNIFKNVSASNRQKI